MKVLIILAISLLTLSSCKREDPLDLSVDGQEKLSTDRTKYPTESLEFHGLPDNYDVKKGIWYDASNSKNDFQIFNQNKKPIKVSKGIFDYDKQNTDSENLKGCDLSLPFSFIRTYHKGFFKLNTNLGTKNGNNCTFVSVIRPINFYRATETQNFIITENYTGNTINEYFTCLRIAKTQYCMQQRTSFDNYNTLDTRYTDFSGIDPTKTLQLLVGVVEDNEVRLYINGALVAKNNGYLNVNNLADITFIGGSRFYHMDLETPCFFDGLIFETLIYSEALSENDINKLSTHLIDKYKILR